MNSTSVNGVLDRRFEFTAFQTRHSQNKHERRPKMCVYRSWLKSNNAAFSGGSFL